VHLGLVTGIGSRKEVRMLTLLTVIFLATRTLELVARMFLPNFDNTGGTAVDTLGRGAVAVVEVDAVAAGGNAGESLSCVTATTAFRGEVRTLRCFDCRFDCRASSTTSDRRVLVLR
jgi:hypothetical protein